MNAELKVAMSKEIEEKIKQLQLSEQSLQALLSQKQGLQVQLLEIDSALKELDKTEEAYRIIGNVMVLADKPDLQAELGSKKETIELRVKSIDRQESATREKAAAMQKEVMEGMKNDSKNGKQENH